MPTPGCSDVPGRCAFRGGAVFSAAALKLARQMHWTKCAIGTFKSNHLENHMIRNALSLLILGTLSWAATASVQPTVTPSTSFGTVQVARQGADDPAGHTRREDRRADRRRADNGAGLPNVLARRGADDPAGHTRREDRRADRRQADSSANLPNVLARHGADDPAGHTRREDRRADRRSAQGLNTAPVLLAREGGVRRGDRRRA